MSPRVVRLTAGALAAALAVGMGLQLAWWAWRMAAPPWEAALATAPAGPAAPRVPGRQLFGDRDAGAPAPAGATQAATGLRLKGVFAVDGRTLSAAVINAGGRDETVLAGQEFRPGLTLKEVHADHVVVSRNGAAERIPLERHGRVATTAQSTAAGPAPTSFRLNVASSAGNNFSLSRQELNTVLQDPRQINFLGRIGPAPGGGVRVDDAATGTLAYKLGFLPGDVITGINGQPINSPGDLARLYAQFNTLTAIRAEIRRAGVPVSLFYNIQN